MYFLYVFFFLPDFRKNFIIKKIPESNSLSHNFHDCFGLFDNEITAYEIILPEYVKYLNNKSRYSETKYDLCFPKYNGQCRSFLVLQDLLTEGYQMVNRIKGFTKNECSLILQVLYHHHHYNHYNNNCFFLVNKRFIFMFFCFFFF